jgi:hypothetical protein
MRINKFLLFIIVFCISMECYGQTIYQMKFGNNEFQERMSFHRPKNIESFDVFYADLLKALEARNYIQVAALVKYPIKLELNNKYIHLQNKTEFVKHGKAVMDDIFIRLLLCEQEELYFVSKGVQLGRGDLWFNTVIINDTEMWKIIAINN